MSAALELVKIALQAYGTGDCEITIQLADPLIRWDERASRPDGELIWGQDEVLEAMHRYQDGWDEYRFEVEKIAEVDPGRIVGLCRERGRTEEGLPVDRRYGSLWIVEAGRIASWATYLTPKEAVRAARELGGGRFDAAEEAARQGAGAGKGATGAAKGAAKKPARSRESAQPAKRPPASTASAAKEGEARVAAFNEQQRAAAKRRAAIARAARGGARKSRTG